METNGSNWKLLVSYRTWARLTPTLTHVVTCGLVTSGAKGERCQVFTDTYESWEDTFVYPTMLVLVYVSSGP
jgi:hypothetical protein